MELLYKKIIQNELQQLEDTLSSSISSEINLATEVTQHVVGSGGKRIRPVICILVAKMLNYQGSELIKLASSIELLHTATLIHDDVVDQSSTRRGKESIHTKWDNSHSVLVGDFVYSKAFQLLASLDNPEIIRILADSTNRISEGEVLQLSLKKTEILSKKDYLEIIDRKTAELFKASAITAGSLAACNEDEFISLTNFAISLGKNFQIKDDLLDYFGDEELTGKKLGKDFEEGKFTLPLIIALPLMSKEHKLMILDTIFGNNKSDFKEIIKIIKDTGAIERVEEICNKFSETCFKELKTFPESDYKTALFNIIENINTRVS
jgi:octaprenyl-diphosphate synthase